MQPQSTTQSTQDEDEPMLFYGKEGFEKLKMCMIESPEFWYAVYQSCVFETEEEHLETLKYLYTQGIDIHICNDHLLYCASRSGHLQTVKFLVDKGANVHVGALKVASEHGHLEVAKFLVSEGADVNEVSSYSNILSGAIKRGHLEIVKFLVSKGANVNAENDQAVKTAILWDRDDIADFLVANGAVVGSDVIRYPKNLKIDISNRNSTQ